MAEYMTIENNIVTGIYCGQAEKGSIILPQNHEVRVGEPLTFYNKDYTRKSDIQLMQENLIPIPQGYKIENDNLIEMTFDEKVIAGIDELPHNMKIVDGKLFQKDEAELLEEMSDEQIAAQVRSERDAKIKSTEARINRYRNQKEAKIATTDSATWYKNALLYLEELRNITEQPGFPRNVVWPEEPK